MKQEVFQPNLIPVKYNNHYLFSDYYLTEILPTLNEWKKQEGIQETFQKINDLYQRVKGTIEEAKESENEDKFIRPLLKLLGFIYETQPSVPTTEYGKFPDYAFFYDEKERKGALKYRGKKEFFKNALALGDAKAWNRPLDRKIRDPRRDPFSNQNPSYQIDFYLRASEVKWGVVTTGRLWRLYNRDTSFSLNSYYEVDLISLIEQEDIENFKYFYVFFHKQAFIKDTPEGSFLDRIFKGSVEYAEKIGDELKERVYEALKSLVVGFLKFPQNNLDEYRNVETVYSKSLILLYRLLFIFYAESRKLLPVENPAYFENYSLSSIKKETAKLELNRIPVQTTKYCSILKNLFKLINQGMDSKNAPFKVPAYNGGLFDPNKHSELEKWLIGDKFLTEAIDLLARIKTERGLSFVDYRSLGVRHLGSIYEGLLEYCPKIATENLIVKKEKGKEKYFSAREFPGKAITVKRGDIYLETDKGERKLTGSYYTPDYVVRYIVENTLKPLCDELENKIRRKVRELKEKIKTSCGESRRTYEKKLEKVRKSFDDEVLKLKVLDPAMGSGHFLVRATEYLAERIVGNDYTWDEQAPEGEAAVMFWRRRVVERCIYGVDLNPLAVELAKLSLWLSTVATDKPLSFLDHHFRCGNSLVGAKVRNLRCLPKISKKRRIREDKAQLGLFERSLGRRLPILLSNVIKMLKKPSDVVEQIREKENIYNKILDMLTPFKEVANVWTSVYFGNEKIDYDWMLGLLDTRDRWKEIKEKGWFKKAEGMNKEKHFFHWELEFPEVFFDEHGKKKDNSGFDAVVGNPPWVESKFLESSSKKYYEYCFSTMKGQYDVFNGFIEVGKSLLCKNGFFGMILPNRFCANPDYLQLRILLLKEYPSIFLKDYGDGVFPEVHMPSCILIATSQSGLRNMDIESQSGISFSLTYDDILRSPGAIFRIDSSPALEKILKKCQSNSSPLVTFYDNARGVEVGKSSLLVSRVRTANSVPFVVGEDLLRYMFAPSCYIKLGDPNTDYKTPSLYKGNKILVRKTGHGINASVDINNNYVIQVIYIFKAKDGSQLNDYYVLGLINSHLMHEIYYSLFGEREKRTFPHIRQEQFLQLPIRRITFTTHKDKRKKLTNKVKSHYETYLKTESWDSILSFIQERLLAKPKESDVIHDFLSFLAEKMIEYNKDKNQEIESFLMWLEREIGTGIEKLSSKTAIKNYHEDTIEHLLNILKKNRKNLKVDPGRREFQEELIAEFDKSIVKLNPLKRKIQLTDRLIDRVVYKLYGLSNEEIKVVEKSVR